MTTKILKCSCKHEEQDLMYGKNMRVFNKKVKRSPGDTEWRCTVCRKEQ